MDLFLSSIGKNAYRLLGFVEDVLIIMSPYRIFSTQVYCQRAYTRVDDILESLGLSRQTTKAILDIYFRRVCLLGVVFDTSSMQFSVMPNKVIAIRHKKEHMP